MKSRTEAWIADAVIDTEKGARCVAVAIYHFGPVGSSHPEPYQIDRIALTGTQTPEQIAKRFDHRVQNHCRDLSGPQLCKLYAWYDDQDEPNAELPFHVKGMADAHESVDASEKGLLRLSMEQQKSLTSQYLGALNQLLDGFKLNAEISSTQNKALLEDNEKLRANVNESYDIIGELTAQQIQSANAQRAEMIAQEMAVMKAKKEEHLQETLLKWAPALVNTILQRKVFPEASQDTALVNGLLENMNPQQIEFFLTLVPPEVAGMVAARANDVFRARKERLDQQHEVQRLTAAVVTPESELQ